MKITYAPEADVLRILLSNIPVADSHEDKPGIIIDYDKDGNVVSLKISDASKRMENPYAVEYLVTFTQPQERQDSTEEQQTLSLEQRRALMKLPIAERRRILAQQAEVMIAHYQQNQEWKELLTGDIIEY